MFTADCHTHPFQERRTIAGVREFAEAALVRNLRRLVFTEHAPLSAALHPSSHFLTEDEFADYYECCLQIREEYRGRLAIVIGAEFDYHPDNLDMIRQVLRAYPLEHVGGSLHVHGDYWASLLSQVSAEERIAFALDQTLRLVQSGLFTCLMHFDFFRWKIPGYNPREHVQTVDRIMNALVQSGMKMEINTSGIYRDFKSFLPCLEVLRRAKMAGVRLCCGSDAHQASKVADYFEELPAFVAAPC